MKCFRELDRLLKEQDFSPVSPVESDAFAYARAMAQVENVVAVVSDLRGGSSRIYAGAFAGVIGLEDYSEESSIWEKKILSKMNAAEQEEKFLAELRFLNYIHRMPARRRRNYYLVSRLRFNGHAGVATDVLHRMYYISEGDSIRFAVCLYGPLPPGFKVRSAVVNSVTGTMEELGNAGNSDMLSRRERQILLLIGSGSTTASIAAELGISPHTVSRHRQNILSRLRAKNSHEALRTAVSLGIL